MAREQRRRAAAAPHLLSAYKRKARAEGWLANFDEDQCETLFTSSWGPDFIDSVEKKGKWYDVQFPWWASPLYIQVVESAVAPADDPNKKQIKLQSFNLGRAKTLNMARAIPNEAFASPENFEWLLNAAGRLALQTGNRGKEQDVAWEQPEEQGEAEEQDDAQNSSD